jgi:hypothetical protein
MVLLRGTESSWNMLYSDRMLSIMPAKRGDVNTSGCDIAVSTLRLMFSIIMSRLGTCLV